MESLYEFWISCLCRSRVCFLESCYVAIYTNGVFSLYTYSRGFIVLVSRRVLYVQAWKIFEIFSSDKYNSGSNVYVLRFFCWLFRVHQFSYKRSLLTVVSSCLCTMSSSSEL